MKPFYEQMETEEGGGRLIEVRAAIASSVGHVNPTRWVVELWLDEHDATLTVYEARYLGMMLLACANAIVEKAGPGPSDAD